MLADKLEAFDNTRRSLPNGPRRHVKASETVNHGRQVSPKKPERLPKREYSHPVPNERSPLRCYGCGRQGVIKSRCPTCNPNSSQRTDVATNNINAYTTQTRSPRLTTSRHNFLWNKGTCLCRHRIFTFNCWGKDVPGTDFLSSAGLVLDVKNTCWYFWDNPTHKYPFGKELDTPSIAEMSSNTCQLREGEGESLTSVEKEKFNLPLESFQNIFEPGGEATNILKHHINKGNCPPIYVPIIPLRKRGRPPKVQQTPGSS
ncbi:uncharacterized protein TNIN_399471 [Trichonephila inaurata madagascariensis]|uniref:CCHC-type domain-containing protein n=1 Tax=Trichonephila inaurata madagascariensis TaxID=2747483 RepID=A0A8X7C8T9_9ARAC|nr:uncharacterized protein TNIN_399471 [Trichonephila inaurata madagascariensis]